MFDEIEKQAEKQLDNPQNVEKLANEAENAAGGKDSKYGRMIEEGKGLYGQHQGNQNQGGNQGR